MPEMLRILLLEDRPSDARLVEVELKAAGFVFTLDRVQTEPDFLARLEPAPDLILADYNMPQFDALRALRLLREHALDIPFIIVSGTIGEDIAVTAMKEGAHDYILKDRMRRLGPAIRSLLEQKKIQEAQRRLDVELREIERRFRQIAENIREVFLLVDTQMKQTFYVSPAYEEIWGQTCASLYANPASWSDAIHPEDRERTLKEVMPHNRMVPFDVHFRILRPDGSMRWIRARGFPIRNDAGEIYRFAGIAEDITEQKHSAEVQARMAAIVDSSDDAIIGESLDGIITNWNKGAERLFGYTSEEVIGSPVLMLFPPGRLGEQTTIAANLQRGEYVHHIETVRRRKDGTPVDISLTLSPIRDEAGRLIGISKIARNISERLRLEAQLQQAAKMEAIGQLAGGVAHDFNNLLTVINGRSQLMMNRFKPGEKTYSELELIHRTGERAAGLTRQLLAFSRQQILEPVVLDLNAVAAEMDKMLRHLIREDIKLCSILDPALKRVKADPGQIKQVIMNLVVNARDAMPDGGKLTIETANVELSEEYCRARSKVKPGHYAMLAVSDTGHGMDAAVKAKIFEPFFTTKGLGKGTGLGLAMVFGVVKQSNGHIEVYSEPGKGTTFKVYLPQSQDKSASSASESKTLTAIGAETVLVVEDEEGIRELVRDLLEMSGYTVLAASNGKEALQLCQTHKGAIHLLVTDVVMPEMGGPELVKRLKVQFPETKVLFTSGYTDHAIVRNGELEAGLSFIQKPFTPANLARKVREVLDKK